MKITARLFRWALRAVLTDLPGGFQRRPRPCRTGLRPARSALERGAPDALYDLCVRRQMCRELPKLFMLDLGNLRNKKDALNAIFLSTACA
jgi:hypothetical protein